MTADRAGLASLFFCLVRLFGGSFAYPFITIYATSAETGFGRFELAYMAYFQAFMNVIQIGPKPIAKNAWPRFDATEVSL